MKCIKSCNDMDDFKTSHIYHVDHRCVDSLTNFEIDNRLNF